MTEKRRLLLVDDDPIILEMLTAAMASDSWEIHTAADALQAFMKARELRPFIIISDVQMANYGKGTDMLRALRKEKVTAATPVIVLTGMEPDKARRLLPPEETLVRLFTKPPEFDQLFAAIAEMTGVDGRAAC